METGELAPGSPSAPQFLHLLFSHLYFTVFFHEGYKVIFSKGLSMERLRQRTKWAGSSQWDRNPPSIMDQGST